MKPYVARLAALALGASIVIGAEGLAAAQTRYDGVTLNIASQNDQFAAVLAALAPQFTEATGAKVNVDILSYPELLTKITADYVGHTKGYDIATVDIVWSGQFAEAGYTVDLTDWIKRDAAEIKVDDIYPVLLASLGGYNGKQVAFPFAGYANVLAYRKDLYEAAGLKPPATMEEYVADAIKLTDPAKKIFGFVANGQKGPAVAQDWMQYNRQFGDEKAEREPIFTGICGRRQGFTDAPPRVLTHKSKADRDHDGATSRARFRPDRRAGQEKSKGRQRRPNRRDHRIVDRVKQSLSSRAKAP
jgi:ABC-type glycerol-3-phosphate transport system substrate-binding protein